MPHTEALETKRMLLLLLEKQLIESFPNDESGTIRKYSSVLQRYRAEIQRRIDDSPLNSARVQSLRECIGGAGDLLADIAEHAAPAMAGWHFGRPASNQAQHMYGVLCDLIYDISWAVVVYEDSLAAVQQQQI